jgi:hypothetical protein
MLEKKEKKMKSKILADFRRDIINSFLGIGIPHQPSIADGVYGPIHSEKVLKFNRKALKNIGKKKSKKVDSRLVGGDDTMRFPVGKPGSKERVDALALQYASLCEDEMSPFTFE